MRFALAIVAPNRVISTVSLLDLVMRVVRGASILGCYGYPFAYELHCFGGKLVATSGTGMRISVVLPAKNEAGGLPTTLASLRALLPEAEVIVVDDGSTDGTDGLAQAAGAKVIRSPYSMGNGAAIKRGARAASGKLSCSWMLTGSMTLR